MKSAILGIFFCLPFWANAGQWVTVDLSSQDVNHSKPSVSPASAKTVHLKTMPKMKLSWFDERNNLIERESVIDPRAVWPLLHDHENCEGHETFILTNRDSISFRKPVGAISLSIEYLNLDLSRESRKVSF